MCRLSELMEGYRTPYPHASVLSLIERCVARLQEGVRPIEATIRNARFRC